MKAFALYIIFCIAVMLAFDYYFDTFAFESPEQVEVYKEKFGK